MNALSSIALSGLNAAQTQLDASANNIANLSSTDYHRELVSQTEQPGGGVGTQVSRAAQPGDALEQDVVGQLMAKNSFMANLAVFKTSVRLTGTLLNTTA